MLGHDGPETDLFKLDLSTQFLMDAWYAVFCFSLGAEVIRPECEINLTLCYMLSIYFNQKLKIPADFAPASRQF